MDVRILTQGPHAILRAEREEAAKIFALDEVESKKLHKQYRNQLKQARDRGVLFDLSYLDWLNIWMTSGKLTERGRGPGKYCMGRKDDTGGYTKENVEIIEWLKNTQLGARNRVAYINGSLKDSQISNENPWIKLAQSLEQRLDELISPLEKLRETLRELQLGKNS